MYKLRFPVSLGKENPSGQQWAYLSSGQCCESGPSSKCPLSCEAQLSGESLSDQPGPWAFEYVELDLKQQLSVSDVASPTRVLLLGGRSEAPRVTVFFLPLSFK